MGMNDENEIIKFGCDKCKIFKEGTYKELFGDLPSLALLPKLVCSECKSTLCLEMTGRYKLQHKIELVNENLAFCTVCKGGEGDLTTECCGRPMTEEEHNRVYKVGDLDFINGKWIDKNEKEEA